MTSGARAALGASAAGPAPADHHLRDDGHHHAGAGHHHRQRLAALHAGQPVGHARAGELGAHLLRGGGGRDDGARRLAGRRASASRSCSSCASPASRPPRCCAASPRASRRSSLYPGGPGHVRRRTGAAVADRHAGDLSARAARLGHVAVGPRRDDRPDHGADPRRLAHGVLLLALDLLHQRPLRHRHRRSA